MDFTKEEVEKIILESCDSVKEKQPMLFVKKHDITAVETLVTARSF